MWNFSSRDRFSPVFSDRSFLARLRFAAFVKHTLWKKNEKTTTWPLNFFLKISLQNFWRQTMRHKLPCELLTYACLHMIPYSQSRLRFEGLTAVEFPLLWIIQIIQLIHHGNLFLFFNSFKLLLPRAEFRGNVGHVGTERSQLHEKPWTLQMKEQRAAINCSHPSESVVVCILHQVSWQAQKLSPFATASLSFHLVKSQLQCMLMANPGIFQFKEENYL